MNINEIIEKYLPMLQDLQRNVAGSGLRMTLTIDRTVVDCTIAQYDEADKNLIEFISEIFNEGTDDETLGQRFINLSAFFAAHCITTPTGVASPICLN